MFGECKQLTYTEYTSPGVEPMNLMQFNVILIKSLENGQLQDQELSKIQQEQLRKYNGEKCYS